jgi:hypothetical protein
LFLKIDKEQQVFPDFGKWESKPIIKGVLFEVREAEKVEWSEN